MVDILLFLRYNPCTMPVPPSETGRRGPESTQRNGFINWANIDARAQNIIESDPGRQVTTVVEDGYTTRRTYSQRNGLTVNRVLRPHHTVIDPSGEGKPISETTIGGISLRGEKYTVTHSVFIGEGGKYGHQVSIQIGEGDKRPAATFPESQQREVIDTLRLRPSDDEIFPGIVAFEEPVEVLS